MIVSTGTTVWLVNGKPVSGRPTTRKIMLSEDPRGYIGTVYHDQEPGVDTELGTIDSVLDQIEGIVAVIKEKTA